jgi:aerobic carbon-monoxide dehydrogenase medium subunit
VKPAAFRYLRPTSLDQALALLADADGQAKPIAGGQSLVPMMAFRLAEPGILVDIGRLPGLSEIRIDAEGTHFGPLVRWRDIERDARLATAQPLIAEAVRHIAHYQVRNRGTIGGSCAHADPAAEMPGVAVTCEAQFSVASRRGRRTLAANEFFVGPLSTALEPDELIVGIHFPPWPASRRCAFEELARRRGDFAMAGVAVFYDAGEDGTCRNAHIGVIGLGDRPMRLREVEQLLEGRRIEPAVLAAAGAAARDAVEPHDDIHAPASYRKALAGVLLERALAQAAAGGRQVEA